MTTATKFDLFTATPAEVAAHVEATYRAEHMNTLEKARRLSDLRFTLSSAGQIQYQARKLRDGFADETNRLTPEQEPAARAFFQAQYDWLVANPGDDLTPEVIAQRVEWARHELPRLQDYRSALSLIQDADDWNPHAMRREGEAPQVMTRTHETIANKYKERIKEVTEDFMSALTAEQVTLLRELSQVHMRRQKRFILERMAADSVGEFRFIDLRLATSAGGFFSAVFDRCIEEARTLKEIKGLCAAWHMPIEVRGGVVYSRENTRDGIRCFFIRPIDLSSDEARAPLNEWRAKK